MKRRLLYLTFFFAFAATTPATLRGQYLHPKVSSKETAIRSVVLMPARVEIIRQSMRGPEGMAAESDLLSTRVSQLITEALAAKHVTAASGVSVGEAGASRTYTISDLQARYDALLPKIVKKPKDVKKGRFTLGDEVLNLNLDKTTDAIVFVRGQGQKLTKGKSTLSLLTLSLNFSYLMLTIGVVDAHTGAVLVFATPIAITDVTSPDEKPLRKAIEKSLKKLPPAP